MEAERPPRPAVREWGPRRAGGRAPGSDWRPENQKREWRKCQSNSKSLTKDGRRLTSQLEDIQAERENPLYSNFYPSQTFNGLGESHQYWGRQAVSLGPRTSVFTSSRNPLPDTPRICLSKHLGRLWYNQVDVWNEPSQPEEQWWLKETLNSHSSHCPGKQCPCNQNSLFLSAASHVQTWKRRSELTVESGRRNQVCRTLPCLGLSLECTSMQSEHTPPSARAPWGSSGGISSIQRVPNTLTFAASSGNLEKPTVAI